MFEIPLPEETVGIAKGAAVDAASLLTAGKPIMVMPEATMRVEWIPNAAERWDPNQEPLKGNYDEYPKRQNPKIDEQFYRGGTTGYLLDPKLAKRPVDNWNTGEPKPRDSWLIDVPYGPKQGEYVLPTRGHKTQTIVAGHFNTFPSIPVMQQGRRIAAWAYRTQLAPNFLVFDAQEFSVEGTVTAIDGQAVTLRVPSKDGPKEVQHNIDDDAEFFSLGRSTSKSQVLKKGNEAICPIGPHARSW
jgi:hypothetical protein